MKRRSHLLILMFLLPFLAFAQSDKMETERPGESLNPETVLKSHFQLEAGFRLERNKNEDEPDNKYLYPTLFLKYGVTKKLELGMLIEDEADYENTPQKHRVARGFLPLKLGVKYNLLKGKGIVPKTSVIAGADIPKFASGDFKGDFVAPLFRLAMENTISKKVFVVYNIGEEWQEDDVHGEFSYSLCPQLEVSEKCQLFAEISGHVCNNRTAENLLDAGFLYQVKPNVQFDFSAGTGISRSAADYFAEIGFSFRLPR